MSTFVHNTSGLCLLSWCNIFGTLSQFYKFLVKIIWLIAQSPIDSSSHLLHFVSLLLTLSSEHVALMFKALQWLLDLPNKCQCSYMTYKALLNLFKPFLIFSHFMSFCFLPQVLWSSETGLSIMPCSGQTCSHFRAFALITHHLVPASSFIMLFPRHLHGSLTFLMSYLKWDLLIDLN